jgi:hypothetical protein
MDPISLNVTLHNTRLERLTRDRDTSLLGPFESYKDNEVLLKLVPGASEHIQKTFLELFFFLQFSS